MTTPTFDVYGATLLESCEEILASNTLAADLVTYVNNDRSSDPSVSEVPDVAIEIMPASLDAQIPPQSYPAVRLDLLDAIDYFGVNMGVQRTEHLLEVRVFSRTTDTIQSLAAAGKRTLATTANVRARHEARIVRYTLEHQLVNYTVNGESNGVYNVLPDSGSTVEVITEDYGMVIKTTFTLRVFQRSRSGRFGYQSGALLAEQAANSGAVHIWAFASGAETTDTGTDGTATLTLANTARAASSVPGSEGSVTIDATNEGARTGSTVNLGLNADRAIEIVLTFPNGASNGVIFASDQDGTGIVGRLAIQSTTALTLFADNGGELAVGSLASVGASDVVYVLITYDASANEHASFLRVEGGSETTATLAQASGGSVANHDFAIGSTALQNPGTPSNFVAHFCAIYNSIPSASHRAQQQNTLKL